MAFSTTLKHEHLRYMQKFQWINMMMSA